MNKVYDNNNIYFKIREVVAVWTEVVEETIEEIEVVYEDIVDTIQQYKA